ncbi:hypothetical protein ACVNPS_01720 [Candidatus Bipolaricaulota sp. J31]
MATKRALMLVGLMAFVGTCTLAISDVHGTLEVTVKLLPVPPELYSAVLELTTTFAGWEITSESKFYDDGWRYQNFYLDGTLGDLEVWGKIYFHAQDVRYQKSWINLEVPLPGEDNHLRFSFNHWASVDDYFSSDVDMFGPWPCSAAIPWDQAWRYFGSSISVEGPVMGYYHPSYLKLNIGRDYPDPDRFEIYIPAAYVDDFEAVFGDDFWVDWAASGQVICVTGTIKGYRWTSGGPRDEGYSVAQIYLTDPNNLKVGGCEGTPPPLSCPGQVIRWFEAHMHGGETLWIQGPVVSITGPGTYWGHPDTYRVRIGGGGTVDNRVEVIMTSHPGWTIESFSSFDTVVCVYGTITMEGDVAVIHPADLIATKEDPCCTPGPIPFINNRVRVKLDPITLTVDFGDCCEGFSFRRAELELSDLSVCCGLVYDANLVFSKRYGFEELTFKLSGIQFPCCDISLETEVSFTLDGKSVSVKPVWEGFVTGCLEVYGDLQWGSNAVSGFELYGFAIECDLDSVSIRAVTAFDPDKVEDMTDVSFYTGEFEYLELAYVGSGCCGEELTFTSEFWFGSGGLLFDLQRTRFNLEFPIYEGFTVVIKGQWDFSDPSPLDWFDIGWKVEF